jgi:ketosteroid isomerase-like protein
MHNNEETIRIFYTSFQNRDHATMQGCYAENASFSDPVFTNLDSAQVRAMWEMFCVKSGDLDIIFRNINANETNGSAEWIATYTFSRTGNKVVNHIRADFGFENGKIVQHNDSFGFYRWARQALGLPGLLLGWTPFIQNKVRETARQSLERYMKGSL